jgi:hypothetical protein
VVVGLGSSKDYNSWREATDLPVVAVVPAVRQVIENLFQPREAHDGIHYLVVFEMYYLAWWLVFVEQALFWHASLLTLNVNLRIISRRPS